MDAKELRFIDAAWDLYCAFVGLDTTLWQKEALAEFAAASNDWPDCPVIRTEKTSWQEIKNTVRGSS